MKFSKCLFYTLICSTLFISSCNNSKLEEENERLRSKLNENEALIKRQISNTEDSKEQIELLKDEIEKLSESSSEKSLSELYNDVKSAVYIIFTENEKGISIGSAFVISDDGVAISNYHVFENASAIIAVNENGDEYLVSEIIDTNEEEDYIVFRFGPLSNPIPYVNISKKKSSVGESVFAVGNPRGLFQTLSQGIVSSYRGNMIQTTAEITHGSSGGPLFNNKGEVIGITTEGLKEANLNFAIDIQTLNTEKYLNTNITKYDNNLGEYQLIQKMSKYYQALIDKDYYSLNYMYATYLSRYHSFYSVSRDIAINDHRDYLKKYDVISVEIMPNSFKSFEGRFGYTLQYKLDYRIRSRTSGKYYNYILNTVSVIDNEGYIESIYDNILVRN